MTSKSSLTVSTDGKSVQVAFRVVEDQLTLNPTPVNRSWSTSLLRNGALVFSGVLSTQPSGSFTVLRTFAASPSTTPTTFLGAAKTLDGREAASPGSRSSRSPFSPETGGRRAFGFRLSWLRTGLRGS